MKSLLPIALVLSTAAAVAPLQQLKNPDRLYVVRAEAMSEAAQAWLAVLPEELRQRAQLSFDGAGRTQWGYMLGERAGVALGEQSPEERRLFDELLRAGLSLEGYLMVHSILGLEEELKQDPGDYFAAVFGDPTGGDPWGWRLEGHHVSLNFTVHERDFVTATPLFLGANPAQVQEGERAGFEPFYAHERLVRDLLDGVPPEVRKAKQLAEPPQDILFSAERNELAQERIGIQPANLGMKQNTAMMKLLNHHVATLHEDLMVKVMNRYREHMTADIDVVFSGGEPGKPLYFRLQSLKKDFVFEYLNRGNHVHCVLRDFNEDFGNGPIAAWEKRKAEETDEE